MTMTLSETTRPARTASETSRASRAQERLRPAASAGLRIVASFLFVLHGLQGLVGAFGGIDGHGAAVAFLAWPGWWASVLELVAGALVLLGLYTRPAALLCSGAMAYAYFTVHQPIALLPLENMGEPAVLYCWIFLVVAVTGAGPYGLDAIRSRRKRRSVN